MKIRFLFALCALAMLPNTKACLAQQPSGPGEALRHSQDTMEYYRLQRELHHGRKRLDDEKSSAEKKHGKEEEIERNQDDDQVIQFFDEPETDKTIDRK